MNHHARDYLSLLEDSPHDNGGDMSDGGNDGTFDTSNGATTDDDEGNLGMSVVAISMY